MRNPSGRRSGRGCPEGVRKRSEHITYVKKKSNAGNLLFVYLDNLLLFFDIDDVNMYIYIYIYRNN